jgi:hypothetical protein
MGRCAALTGIWLAPRVAQGPKAGFGGSVHPLCAAHCTQALQSRARRLARRRRTSSSNPCQKARTQSMGHRATLQLHQLLARRPRIPYAGPAPAAPLAATPCSRWRPAARRMRALSDRPAMPPVLLLMSCRRGSKVRRALQHQGPHCRAGRLLQRCHCDMHTGTAASCSRRDLVGGCCGVLARVQRLLQPPKRQRRRTPLGRWRRRARIAPRRRRCALRGPLLPAALHPAASRLPLNAASPPGAAARRTQLPIARARRALQHPRMRCCSLFWRAPPGAPAGASRHAPLPASGAFCWPPATQRRLQAPPPAAAARWLPWSARRAPRSSGGRLLSTVTGGCNEALQTAAKGEGCMVRVVQVIALEAA